MILLTTVVFLLLYRTQESESSRLDYGTSLYNQQHPTQYAVQRFHPPPKSHFRPTPSSSGSSGGDQVAAANMPSPQILSLQQVPAATMPAPQVVNLPQIEYAYQGGDVYQQPDFSNLEVHQGEVLNHVRQQAHGQSITPRPHPVYQQMNPQGGNVGSPGPSQPQPQPQPPPDQPQQVQSTAVQNLHEVDYDPHGGYDDHHGHPEHHGYPDHHEYPPHDFGGYHYAIQVHPPPPPRPLPQKPKQTESQYAYYYIGRHLWYIPLYFSIYFIAYVGLLVLKSISRHKVLLPYASETAAAQANNRDLQDYYALRSIEEGKQKYYMK